MGREVGSAQQTTPLWEFELRYEGLRDITQNIAETLFPGLTYRYELQDLLGLYLASAGEYGIFFFDDWTDHSRAGQVLGVGDGETVEFRFVRTIEGDSGLLVTEGVGAVNVDADEGVNIFINSVSIPDSEWGISEDLTTLVFNSPPANGDIIQASFFYYYRCRWISDYQEVEEFVNNMWSAASVRFRSTPDFYAYVPPTAITPIQPPEPPTPDVTNCLKHFLWFNHLSPTPLGGAGQQSIDKFSNLWVYEADTSNKFHTKTYIYNSVGSQLAGYTQVDLADEIDSWYGSSIVIRSNEAVVMAASGFLAKPIMQGRYLLAYLPNMGSPVRGTAGKWFAILDPTLGGELNVIGACYVANLTGPPYGLMNILDAANGQGSGDPLLVFTHAFLGAAYGTILVLPSVDDMVSGLLSTVISGVDYPCLVPTTMFYPIGSADLSDHLFVGTSGGRNPNAGFVLPNDSEETILYFYANRRYMEFCLTNSYAVACKEIKDVIAPVYPHGAMLKINLGEVDWATLSTNPLPGFDPSLDFFGDTTDSYSVDNSNWQTSSFFSVIPMPDEYTYSSNGAIGGRDCYALVPAAIYKRLDGKFWLPFYKAGIDDAQINQLGLIWDGLRLFEWDPATEIGTLLVYDNCLLHTASNVNVTGGITPVWLIDDSQVMEFADDAGVITISVRGMVYKTDFYRFTP